MHSTWMKQWLYCMLKLHISVVLWRVEWGWVEACRHPLHWDSGLSWRPDWGRRRSRLFWGAPVRWSGRLPRGGDQPVCGGCDCGGNEEVPGAAFPHRPCEEMQLKAFYEYLFYDTILAVRLFTVYYSQVYNISWAVLYIIYIYLYNKCYYLTMLWIEFIHTNSFCEILWRKMYIPVMFPCISVLFSTTRLSLNVNNNQTINAS